jgi:hypothetical protein
MRRHRGRATLDKLPNDNDLALDCFHAAVLRRSLATPVIGTVKGDGLHEWEPSRHARYNQKLTYLLVHGNATVATALEARHGIGLSLGS